MTDRGRSIGRRFGVSVAVVLLAINSSPTRAQTPSAPQTEKAGISHQMHGSPFAYQAAPMLDRLPTSSAGAYAATDFLGQGTRVSARRHLVTGLIVGSAVGALAGIAVAVTDKSRESPLPSWIAVPIFTVGGAAAGTIVGGLVYLSQRLRHENRN